MSYRLDTDKTWAETYRELGNEFMRWGVGRWSAEPNVPSSRVNGVTFNSRAETAVTLRYWKGEREVVLTYDKQDSPRSNLRALYLCIKDMRMLDVRGLGGVAQSAYMQLAAPKAESDPWEVLGLRPGAARDEIEAMFRVKAKAAHPDAGGSDEAMAALNTARARLLDERKG